MTVDMTIKVPRNMELTVTNWLSVDEFTGLLTSRHGTQAAYGWSKGGSFWVYRVHQGSIMRVATIKREALDCPLLA